MSVPVLEPPTPDRTRLEHDLKSRVAGEVRFSETARALYATDASPYEIKPHGVVLPKTADDVRAVLAVARHHNVPVLPRGGGTSLAGQTVGAAIVVDFSKYMDKIVAFDAAERLVRCEPGVVRDNLNLFLKPHGLQFTPDVATSSRANIGGMVANNSAGTRSIKYGKSVDQVVAMTVMLTDGSVCELRALGGKELSDKRAAKGLEGDIYRTVYDVVSHHADEITAKYPKVMRRVGGYNLDEFIGQPFNLAKLVCGSEGTLAVILDVTLKLDVLPKHKCLALLHFDTLVKALTAVQHVNRHDPTAVEILDDNLFALGLKNPNLTPLVSWRQGEPAAVLMIEFDGESEAEMRGKLAAMQGDLELASLSYGLHMAFDEATQNQVWEFRKGGLGILATMKGDAKPTPFIEDAAVPVKSLPHYIPEVIDTCRKYGVETVMYAHASVGVLHVRPILNLKDPRDVEKFQRISEDIFALVKKYGGSWSGEHGDGLIRSYQNRNLFGDVIYQDFRRIKRAFDPQGLMNPGKITDAPAMTENLRYGGRYTLEPVNTTFDFSKDGGFGAAIEMCTGVGHCRKTVSGTMCPSYMATRDEDHSTRGRANVLREALSGHLPGGLSSHEVYGVMDLCLECKACKAECPSQVDMAKLKYEFLSHYHAAHGVPLSALVLGNAATVAPLGRLAAPLANALLPLKPVRWLMEKTAGVDRRRVMPRYADVSFEQLYHQAPPAAYPERPTVALFVDTWTNFNDPHIGQAAVRVLTALGYNVELAPYRCCGRPHISKGLLKRARTLAEDNIRALYPYVKRGVPVLGLEPSCVTAFQDDYRDLAPGEMTEVVAKNVKMIDQFLAKEWSSGRLKPDIFQQNGQRILFHGHCQQKAIIGSKPSTAVLGWVSEQVQDLDAGCCGMAGSFGYGHYDVSMTIGEGRLFPAARHHDGDIVACGFSCRHQIKDGTGKRAKHLVEVMAEALDHPKSEKGRQRAQRTM